jgi:ribose transport system substrate-binding protein
MTTSAASEQQQQSRERRRSRFSTGSIALVVLVLAIAALGGWYAGLLKPRPTVALVTNNADPFWDPVIAGAEKAAAQYHVNLKVVKGNGDQVAQSASVRQLLGEGIRGLGISPIDGEAQSETLRQAAIQMPLVTMDSDSPNSSRLWFVGTDNYSAGRQVGAILQEAAPDGGEVLICVGSITAENGKLRRQGVIDELLDRPYSANGPFDAIDAPIKGNKYVVVGTCVDLHDKDRATQMVVEAVGKHPNLKCIVALYSYSAPAVLKALEQTGKLGHIKVIGFDVLPETVAAVKSGNVFATMQQAQFDIGFDTIRTLADALSGDSRVAAAAAGTTPMRYLGVSEVTQRNIAVVQGEPRAGDVPGGEPAVK